MVIAMRKIYSTIVGLLVLLWIITSVAALTDGDISVSGDPYWAIAGGPPVTIRVSITNLSPGTNATVIPSVDPMWGGISPITGTTNSSGAVSFSFIPNITKGIAPVNIHVDYDIFHLDKIYNQNIDHAGPVYYMKSFYEPIQPVNETIDIFIRFSDKFGNLLDNRNLPEKFTLKLDANGTPGYFIDLGNNVVSYFVEETEVNSSTTIEEVHARYHVPEIAGNNWIRLSVMDIKEVDPDSIFLVITGYGDTPYAILYNVEPHPWADSLPNVTYARLGSYFSILYTVVDIWNNPIANVTFVWNTTVDEPRLYTTNYQGKVYLEYAKDRPQDITIYTELLLNSSINASHKVRFIQPAAKTFELTANPQTMASRDSPGRANSTADVLAKVINPLGDVILDEDVTFSILYDTLRCSGIDAFNASLADNKPFFDGDPNPEDEVSIIRTSTSNDTSGYAVAKFHPGKFPINPDDPNYNQTSRCSIDILVVWEGDLNHPKYITMEYMNYPYLRIETSVDRPILKVGENVCTTLTLIGDGWALRPKPVDVVLSMGRGMTMLLDDPDRVLKTRPAAKIFINCLTENADRVGLITFGEISRRPVDLVNDTEIKQRKLVGDDNTLSDDAQKVNDYYPGHRRNYSDYVTLDTPRSIPDGDRTTSLEYDLDDAKLAIDEIVPFNYEPSGQARGEPLRYGLYKSIKDVQENGRPRAIKAVIVLIDIERDWFGDPLAPNSGDKYIENGDNPRQMQSGGNWIAFNPPYTGNWSTPSHPPYDTSTGWQNLTNYARYNNIVVFSIIYNEQSEPTSAKKELTTIAEGTGGFYSYAATQEELESIYKKIAGALRKLAAADTEAYIDFGTINVSHEGGMPEQMAGSDVFNYTYIEGKSTYIVKYDDYSAKSINSTKMVDDTINWTENHAIQWYVGNISLNEGWNSTFCMDVKTNGTINIFGPGSYIHFVNDALDDEIVANLKIPDTYVTVLDTWAQEPVSYALIDVYNLNASLGSSQDLLNFTRQLNYTGNKTVIQEIFYQFSPYSDVWSNDWIKFDTVIKDAKEGTINGTYSSLLDIRYKIGYVKLKVFAYENIIGGASDQDEIKVDIGTLREPTILIE